LIAISGLYFEDEADMIGKSVNLTFNSATLRKNRDSPQKEKKFDRHETEELSEK